ncbi:response regulator [Ruminococcaceae bacterium OttesenSCG-928-L11]|nr:response regulator [Ruminococcaceae bacterium OttesenSCG-928-L11]
MFGAEATQDVRALEEGYPELLEASCDWAFHTDANLVIEYCYKSRSAVDNVLPANLTGKDFRYFLPEGERERILNLLHPDSVEENVGIETVYRDPIIGMSTLRAIPRCRDGAITGYSIALRRLSDEFLTALKDVYEDGKTVPSSKDLQLGQQRLIATLAAEFAKAKEPDALFPYAIKMLGNFMGVERCSVFRHDTIAKTYGVVYEWCAPGTVSTKALLQDIPYNDEDEGYIQLTTRPYIAVDDTFRFSGAAYQVQRENGIHAFVDLPILVDGEFWGFLGADCSSGPHYWTESEFHMLQSIGSLMASALEKKRMSDELHDAYSKLQEIVENYPGIIWAVDKDNNLTLCEGKALRTMGVTDADLDAVDLSAGHEYAVLANAFDKQNATFTNGDQSYMVEIEGRHFTCETTLLHGVDGEVSGVVGVALDVTEMHRLQQQLELAIKQANQASQAKTDFLSRMSHEIRTPMNAIIGMTEIAKKSDEPERVQYCLSRIERASHQLLGLINDILDISKIEANKLEIVRTEFDFEKMLQTVYNMVQPRVEEKKLNFSFDLEGMLDRRVLSDELRINQVITNLLSNAVKFTPEGGEISVRIRFQQRTDTGALLRVEVKDTGIGISPEEQDKLFQAFEQADGSITRRFGGSGLGLAICKRIMGLMNGRIWVESETGKGACFLFEVPVQFGEMLTEEPRPEADTREIRVLVIDDSEDVLEYCRHLLGQFHMECDTANSGQAALRLTRQTYYDIIFVDWKMPGMDGIETARAIRRWTSPDTIVILISVADWSDIKPQANSIGVTHFLPKPLLPSTLYNTIVNLTGASSVRPDHDQLAEKHHWENKSILVAEDIEINREILCTLLEPTGVAIECVENGDEATRRFAENPDKYDLILMDVQMPVMDGYEATRRIRGQDSDEARLVPILAMTANAFQEDVQRCLAAGMNGHVAKPLDVNELLSQMAGYLNGN